MFKRSFRREGEDPSYLDLYGEELDLPFFFRYEFALPFFSELPLSSKFETPFPPFSGETQRHPIRLGWSYEGIACRVFYPKKVFKPGLEGDAIELFFDTRDQHDAPYPNRFCHHFVVFPEAVQGFHGREVTRFRGDETHPYGDPSLFEVSLKQEKGGTSVDIFLPRELFCGYDPGQFERLGWSYRILQEGALPEQLIPIKEIASLPALWATLNLKKTLRTSLYPLHVELGAKMAPFSGWEMPLWYSSPTEEHLAVREKAGLFDVSHMTLFELSGEGMTPLLDWLTPTLFSNKAPLTITYTLLMTGQGGVLDDILVYKWDDEHYWVVANAANREKVYIHLQHFAPLKRLERAILALQGPLVETFFAPIPKKMTFQLSPERFVIGGSGYTGEKGVEIYLPPNEADALFKRLIRKGVTPCGLAARDTLRLEKGFALYGHELSEQIAPEESVAAWVLKPRDIPYLGQGKLAPTRLPVALLLEEGIAREGAEIFASGKKVGVVTSGTFSPCLKKGIALGLVDSKAQKLPLEVLVRGKYLPTTTTHLPFV